MISEIFLATMLLGGGVLWSALIVFSMAHHPTGGTDFAMPAFLAGVIVFALGALWWVWIAVRWLI